MEIDAYLAHLHRDAERFAATTSGRLDAPVAACPGWDLRQLAVHTGQVHRWATAAVVQGTRPSVGGDAPADADIGPWLLDGVAALVGALGAAPPHAPTWHPFPFEQQVWVWARRQAHETAVHRWDAEVAATGTSTLDATLAADGIRELVEMLLPRVLSRERVAPPIASLAIRCTDVDGAWSLRTQDGGYLAVVGEHPSDSELRGTAAALLLVLMGRADRATVEVRGDAAAAEAWLALPGL